MNRSSSRTRLRAGGAARFIWLLPASWLGLAACQESSLPSAPEGTPDAGAGPAAAAQASATLVGQDDWIVVFRRGTPDAPGLARRLVAEHGGSVRFTYTHALQGFAGTLPPQSLEGIRRNPHVAYVEHDGVVHKSVVGSWGLDRIDQRALPLDDIYDPGSGRDGTGVTAYIIDTGIDFTLNSGEYGGRASSGPDFIDNDNDASDCDGHGTHVAGTVGSLTYGVAKDVALVAVRVLNCQGSGSYSQVIAGIDWVTGNHAPLSVANMSLGGGASQSLNDAVENSIAAGVTYAVAAGNENTDACTKSPASAPSALTVGATTSSDARSSFSNYGTCLDLFAPGSGITSTVMGGGTGTWSGTSMATPHVTGVAALYLEDNPGWGPADVIAAVLDRATRDVVTDPGPGSANRLLYALTDSGDPCAAGGCPTVEVQWVSGVTVKTNRGKRASGTVSVQVVQVDSGTRTPIAGVTVNGSWTVNGTPDFTTSSGVTGTDGTVELATGMIRNATSFTFCVTGLTGSVVDGTTYAPDSPCSPFGSKIGGGGGTPAPPPTGLSATVVQKGRNYKVELSWTGGATAVDVFRDGGAIAQGVANSGAYTDNFKKSVPPSGTTYTVCNAGTTDCSNDAVLP